MIRDDDYDVRANGRSQKLKVLDNDTSGKGDLIITSCGSCTSDVEYSVINQAHEDCRIIDDGTALRYRPNTDFEGLRRCTYEACDECSVCGEAYVYLCVGDVDCPARPTPVSQRK